MRGQGKHGGHDHLGPDMAARHKRDQAVFHALLRSHEAIRRQVTDLPNGIRAITETDDPELAGLIRAHAHEMHRRLGEGFGLRHWDPAFVEIFAQRDKLRMVVTDTPKGVVIEETSDDPNVATLIRAHGAVVSAFVRSGERAASLPSPLPEEYVRVAS
jgi:hypothetical protein